MVVSPAAARSASKYLYVLTRNLTTNFVGLICGYSIDSHGGLTPTGSTSIDATAPVSGFCGVTGRGSVRPGSICGLYIGRADKETRYPIESVPAAELTVLPATNFNGFRDYYLAIDPGGKYLYAEYYSGANATSIYETSINSDGTLTPLGSVAAATTPCRCWSNRWAGSSSVEHSKLRPDHGQYPGVRIGSDGRLTPIGSTAEAQETIRYMAVDPDGKFLYASVFPDTGGSHIQVYRIGSDGGLARWAHPVGQGGPLAADPAGNFLYELVGNAHGRMPHPAQRQARFDRLPRSQRCADGPGDLGLPDRG